MHWVRRNSILPFENTSKQSELFERIFVAKLRIIIFLNNNLIVPNSAYKTAKPEQLFAAFEKIVEGEDDVKEFMESWVYNAGYPLITVKMADDRTSVEITQKRFLRNKADHHDKTLYHIPITFATNKQNTNFTDTKRNAIMKSEKLNIKLTEPADWIILNVQQTGYYRVNYDDGIWSAISNGLHSSHSDIHVLNRAQVFLCL